MVRFAPDLLARDDTGTPTRLALNDPDAPALNDPDALALNDPDAPVRRTSSEREDLDRLGDEIAEMAAHIHAATWQLLARLAQFDRREGWGNGFRSCAHWLSWRTGIASGAARERVRVARALEKLPQLADAMRHGQLSFAKARAVTRVATPANESELLDLALHATAAHMEKIVRAWRRADRLDEAREERERHARRTLELWQDEDGGWVIRGRLDPEVGALLRRALDAAGETLHGRKADPSMSAGQRRADAIGLIAEQSLASAPAPGRSDRFRVVMHVDADALRTGGEGHAVLDGARVSAETSRRLACDAASAVVVERGSEPVERGGARGERGAAPAERGAAPAERGAARAEPASRTRSIPRSIRRALEQRDRGCRFPGCGLRFCDAHHVRHWADGGATRLDNLVLLCRRHHRAVHEDGFRVTIDARGDVAFHDPQGRPLPEAPVLPQPRHGLIDHQPGLAITPWTATPQWNGEALDVHWTIAVLRGTGRPRFDPG